MRLLRFDNKLESSIQIFWQESTRFLLLQNISYHFSNKLQKNMNQETNYKLEFYDPYRLDLKNLLK